MMKKENKGFNHLYTGNGKGKTTAAIGLAIRALGAGKSVYIGQFVKGMAYSEIKILQSIPDIEVKQYGLDCFILKHPGKEDLAAAQEGWIEISDLVRNHLFDLVILDELTIALKYELISENQVIRLIKEKPPEIELVVTGRYAPKSLYPHFDLITEMVEMKHYFNKGITARKGIEY